MRSIRACRSQRRWKISKSEIPPHLRGLVVAGVRSGQLGDVLLRFSTYAGFANDLKRRLVLSLAYPLLTLAIAIGLSIFVSSFVVTQFEHIFKDFNVPLRGVDSRGHFGRARHQSGLLAGRCRRGGAGFGGAGCSAFPQARGPAQPIDTVTPSGMDLGPHPAFRVLSSAGAAPGEPIAVARSAAIDGRGDPRFRHGAAPAP